MRRSSASLQVEEVAGAKAGGEQRAVDLPRLHGVEEGAVVAVEAQLQALDEGLAEVIGRVRHQHGVLRRQRLQPIGPGAHGLLVEGGVVEVRGSA